MEEEKFFEREKKLEEEEKKIEIQEIEKLREPMTNLMDLLRKNIENEKYSSFLIDDKGGRIPGLILHRTINEIYDREGKNHIDSFFVRGRATKDSRKELDSYISKLSKKLGKKTLIVTEAIYEGTTINILSEILNKYRIPHEIATVWTERGEETGKEACFEKGELKKKVQEPNFSGTALTRTGVPVFCGRFGEYGTRRFANQWQIPGVTTTKEGPIAQAAHSGKGIDERLFTEEKKQKIRQVRKDAEILSNELVDYYSKIN